jgi:hypothetical protein
MEALQLLHYALRTMQAKGNPAVFTLLVNLLDTIIASADYEVSTAACLILGELLRCTFGLIVV